MEQVVAIGNTNLARIGFGKIENIVDQRQQVVAR